MKKHLFIVFMLSITLIFIGISNDIVYCMANNKKGEIGTNKRIIQMNDKELLEFLEEYVESYFFKDEEEKTMMFDLLKTYMVQYDAMEEVVLPYGYTLYHKLSDEIEKAVRTYYKDSVPGKSAHVTGSGQTSTYTPEQNEFYYAPVGMALFNCYGFAVDKRDFVNPGYYSQTRFSLAKENALSTANVVKADLQSIHFNQKCVHITEICPSYSELGNKKAICVRMAFRSDGTARDFHFMKLSSDGWLHKPGGFAVLKHKKTLDSKKEWLCETTINGNVWRLGECVYSGKIYYIVYQANHTYQLTYTGKNYHAGKFHYYEKAYICTNCKESYGHYYERVICDGPPCPEYFYCDLRVTQ